jgi:hypothetical protein
MQRFDFMNVMAAKGASYPATRVAASTPVAANALVAFDVTYQKTFEKLDRTMVDGEPGIIRSAVYTKEAWRFEFSTYLSGSGTAGTAPGWRIPMRACGMTETIVPSGGSAGVTYSLASIHATHEWCDLSLGHALENIFAHGARGNYQIELPTGALPFIRWTFDGAYNEPTNEAMVTPVYTAQPPARPVDVANTTICTVGGAPVCLNNFTFTPGNTVTLKDDAACVKEFFITDREPAGQIVLRTPAELATFNAWQKATAGTLDPVQIQHGPAGSRITINLSGIEFDVSQPTDVDGIKYTTIAYRASHTEGNPSVGSIVVA